MAEFLWYFPYLTRNIRLFHYQIVTYSSVVKLEEYIDYLIRYAAGTDVFLNQGKYSGKKWKNRGLRPGNHQ